MSICTAMIVRTSEDNETLRFDINGSTVDVELTQESGVNGLRQLFERLLTLLVSDEVEIELAPRQDGTTAMYHDVCREWIKLLNQDLVTVRQEMIAERIAEVADE